MLLPHPRRAGSTAQAGFLALLLTCDSSAHAQSEFSGPSLGAQVDFMNTSTELTFDGAPYSYGAPSQTLRLQTAYGLSLGPETLLNLGASTQLGDVDGGRTILNESETEITLSRGTALYVEPAYAIHPDTVLYGKFALIRAQVELAVNDDDPSRLERKLKGQGFGLGVRHLLAPSLYLQIEFMQMNYDKTRITSKDDPDAGLPLGIDATSANVGLGLQF